jgi:hypothetical protein
MADRIQMMPFERVKKIALENVQAISDRLGTGEVSLWSSAAHTLIAAMKTYVDGKPIRARRVALIIQDKVREFIRGLDVRCVGELLELIPKGLDSRLPGWLYGPVDACLEDEGWVLVPRAA